MNYYLGVTLGYQKAHDQWSVFLTCEEVQVAVLILVAVILITDIPTLIPWLWDLLFKLDFPLFASSGPLKSKGRCVTSLWY